MNFSNAISLLSSWNGEEDFQAMLANRPEQERFALLQDLDDFMQCIGYAGEMRVMSELLVRGVEALNGRVDDGFDLVAMRGVRFSLCK